MRMRRCRKQHLRTKAPHLLLHLDLRRFFPLHKKFILRATLMDYQKLGSLAELLIRLAIITLLIALVASRPLASAIETVRLGSDVIVCYVQASCFSTLSFGLYISFIASIAGLLRRFSTSTLQTVSLPIDLM